MVEDEVRIVAETLAAGANGSAVARRYRLRPQQIYAWRRLAHEGILVLPAEGEIGFVPIVASGEIRPPRLALRRSAPAIAGA